ncbi:hypothetical protein PCO31010_04751 [Pandoraea commovens]|uniref:Uncharacterized protein n=1 Tax=Pandoraea commovens TaxID=2508289 RepID=A0A5E4YTV5_9BURK|nr:hypothetical protein PCO31010_04751 [Pandoraea commovens]
MVSYGLFRCPDDAWCGVLKVAIMSFKPGRVLRLSQRTTRPAQGGDSVVFPARQA